MPVSAHKILDEDEMKSLLKKQHLYSALDIVIMVICVSMMIVAPIEKNVEGCKTTRWLYWSGTELTLASISLLLD